MLNIHQMAERWLRRAIRVAKRSNLDFYSISPVLSARMNAWLRERGYKGYKVREDIIVTSRFEEVEVSIGPDDGPVQRIFICFTPYVPKRPTLIFPPLRKRAVA